MPPPERFLDVSPQQGAQFFGSPADGPLTMLNLLRFRQHADYSHAPELAPEAPVSGEQAYRRYMEELEPLLKASGGEVLFTGKADDFLIGPIGETWDYIMLVRQASKETFLAFASDPQAQEITKHRTAAVEDSRLLPIWPDA